MTEEELVALLKKNLRLEIQENSEYNYTGGDGPMYASTTTIHLYYGNTYLSGGSI